MPSVKRLICLAASRKHAAYCVAGIDPVSRVWMRPVSELDDGRLVRAAIQVDGRMPRLGDLLEIPLHDSGPDFGFECENVSIAPGAWRVNGALAAADLVQYCAHERPILHSVDNYVTVQFLQSLPPAERRTLQLVEAFEFEAFADGPSVHGGQRWNASFVSAGGDRLTARITDPVLIEKLETGYRPGEHCLVTVSLSMPYRPADWALDGDPCWKLAAGVIELEAGVQHAPAQPPTAETVATHWRGVLGIGDDTIAEALRSVFGFETFRPNQAEIVRAIIDKRDCFVVMPTGGGKSLCYQLPAHVLPGTCMVISPLIALMKDQVDAACGMGLNAAYLNSSLSDVERTNVFRRLTEGELDLIYVSPERFAMESFVNGLKRVPLSLVAVDEAHCVSEWGHDFRPDYLSLSEIVKHFPETPIAAFTATATHRVQQDIIERLGLRSPLVVRASFNRPNLSYEVMPKHDAESQIVDFVRAHPGEAGIVYRMTRRDVDETADALQTAGVKALAYHAGLEDNVRTRNQDAFSRDEVDVVVATIAFGMGVDKPNVRYVLHGDLPKNMESYYQETGRAGRDGEPARCVLLFGRGDIPRIRYFIDQVEDDTERRRLQASLNEMVSYAGSGAVCRRRRILAYFGESLTERTCGACDVCVGSAAEVDATRDAQIVLSAIARTYERFGAGHIVDIVAGARTKIIRVAGHDQLPTYGAGKDRGKRHWQGVVDELLGQGVVGQSGGRYPVLTLTQTANGILRGERRFTVRRKTVDAPARQTATVPKHTRTRGELFDRLRQVRRSLALERSLPAYMIFSDRTLAEMAEIMPTADFSLRTVHGIGERKLAAYGAPFLREIAAYLAELKRIPSTLARVQESSVRTEPRRIHRTRRARP